jgi:4-amino-4-deoxy-L-arabinose transferase-like glycosyltransferase
MRSGTPGLVAAALFAALIAAVGAGLFARGYWTPDEPREADISWRMSWQTDKAVPLLAGEPFCEKPPLTYWLAGASMKLFGMGAWAARLPNLLYALITALGTGLLARRAAGALAGVAAAAAISTFLLAYQVDIWLATDAPLLAATAVALAGLYTGFHAAATRERLRGYLLMHAALALGFLAKSAAAWLVPALALVTLVIWERRWRELLRFELYAGLLLQAAVILVWVGFVYAGPDGPAHLRVFFWNNLVGRFVGVEAPPELQYAAGHRNSPGKYLLELPMYLWPWTLLMLAAARRAWRQRHLGGDSRRAVRFALAACLPALAVLSLAATARNIYLAPALPGAALLLGWWVQGSAAQHDGWDLRAMFATAVLMLMAAAVMAAALLLVHRDSASAAYSGAGLAWAALGLATAVAGAAQAWTRLRRGAMAGAQLALLAAYLALLLGPAPLLYGQVDRWQDLAAIARAVQRDSAGRPLYLLAPDETTRAMIDLYARTSVARIDRPADAAAMPPRSRLLVRLADAGDPDWLGAAGLQVAARYALPHGRRYALLESTRP